MDAHAFFVPNFLQLDVSILSYNGGIKMLVVVDCGYSHTKAMADGKQEPVIFPSVLGEVQQSHVELNLAERNGYLQVETKEGHWLVGDGAVRQSGMRTRRQDRGWIKTPEYKALVLSAVTELTKSTNVSVEIVTGLPIDYFDDEQILRDRLLGVHTVKRAGRKAQRIEIIDMVVLPQALAAILAEALDNKGKVIPGPISEGMVGLVDIGGHTCGVATFKQLEEIARQTASIDAGLWTPLADIRKAINAAYPGLALEDFDVVETVRQGFLRYYGERRSIAHLTEIPLRAFARRILAEATKVWGNAARLDVLLLAGGGAEIVGPAFKEVYRHTRIVDDPQWANCRGYLRFGRRHYG